MPHPPRTRKSKRINGPAAKPPLGDLPRDIAFRAVARQARIWPQLDLAALDSRVSGGAQTAPPAPMSHLDEAFAHAIYDTVIRRWLTLAHLVGKHLTQDFAGLEPRMRAALLCGAAQIIFLDRVPAHAAINHAVEWAKRMIRPGAAGMVNAVLRKVAALKSPDNHPAAASDWETTDCLPLPDGHAVPLLADTMPTDPLERLGVITSHPLPLLQHWSRAQTPDAVHRRALHSITDPPTILNLRHASAYTIAAIDPAHLQPHRLEGHAVFTGPHAALASLLESHADIWAQDPASSGAIRSIAFLRPRRIIDLCAGLGTKTRQLAFTFPDAEIVATDVDRTRFATLSRTLSRLACDRIHVEPMDKVRMRFGWADLVVLDVPCSNTGVLARRPEASYRFSPDALKSLAATQRQIIADAIPLLTDSPDSRGSILYATCSLEPEENAEIVKWAARWHRFTGREQRVVEPTGLPGGTAAEYHDGAFSVHLVR